MKELFLHIIDGGRLSAYIESRIKSEKTVTRRGPKKKLDPVALKEPRKHEQPALIKANLMQDPPKSDILSLTYLDADNLQ